MKSVLVAAVALLAISCGSGSGGGSSGGATVGRWTPATSMQAARSGHSATVLPSGLVLVAGGLGASGTELASAELFDPLAETWTSTGSMPFAAEWHRAVLVPGGVLAIGGGLAGMTDAVQPLSSVSLYDAAAGTWRSVARMSAPRCFATATLLPTGKVLVTGGAISRDETTATAELYDPATETWSPAAPLSRARSGHAAALLPAGKVLVTGGTGSADASEVYDPGINAWTPAAAMPWVAEGHTMTVLGDGKVVAAGGLQWNGTGWARLTNVAAYDPATDTWTATSSLDRPRAHHSAALLPSGKIVVVGGGHNVVRAGSEVYDPATGGWQDGASMAIEHGDFAATVLLGTGRALVTGGLRFAPSGGPIGPIANVEFFDE